MAFALLMCGTALADTVWLTNGDRLTGTIKSLDNGVLLLNTDYGGDVRIKFAQVQTLESEQELVVRDASLKHDYLARLVRRDPGQVGIDGARRTADGTATEVSTDLTLTDLARVARPRPLLRDATITGTLDLGLDQKSASTTTQNYNAALRGEVRHGLWRHRLGANYNRVKEDRTVSTNNYGGDYTLDRFLTPQAFWQGRLTHRRDWIEDLDRQTAYGTGPGYQFWDDDLGAFSLTGLVGRVHYGFKDDTSENFYAASLRWDYKRYFSARQFEFFARGEVSRPIGDAADFALNSELGLRYNVTSWASLYVKFARNQVSGSRESLNENRVTTGLGVKW